MPSFRIKLLKIQRSLYLKNLRRIQQTLVPDKALDRYAREYHRFLRHYASIVPAVTLIKQVLSSDVVYHGDYHTLRQSQRSVLRILREIADKRPIIFCLEMFHRSDQLHLDRYLRGDLAEKEFLNTIAYRKKWEFRFEHWRPLLDLCKKFRIPVFGINEPDEGKPSLRARDESAAVTVATLVIRNPGTLVYVVDGDYHISPTHLPARVDEKLRALRIEPKRTIIYQNDANLYWQLASQGREDADVLQIDDESFCIINSTPANKLQSYLNWLEYSDDAFHPMHEEWEDLSEESGNTTVPGIIKTICAVLELPYPDEAVSRLEIYYGRHLDFMEMIGGSKELACMEREIWRKIRKDEGFLLEYTREENDHYLIYLPNSSLNSAAEESTHFINAVMRGKGKRPRLPFDRFYSTVMTETIGFFGSKLINERRKVQTVCGIRSYIGSFKNAQKPPPKREKAKIDLCHLLLRHRYLEHTASDPTAYEKKFREVYLDRRGMAVEFATQLGYMLGDRLFYAVKKRIFPQKAIIELFSEDFSRPGKAFSRYLEVNAAAAQRRARP
ncbi:MAG: ChaN family lipoprotein [Chitinispirillaceae bacterium]|nr:ChaN family lipoprotein [Chitinispirillaceae bacterium]